MAVGLQADAQTAWKAFGVIGPANVSTSLARGIIEMPADTIQAGCRRRPPDHEIKHDGYRDVGGI